MIIAATICLAGILSAIFYRRITWGVYALVAALPFERIGAWALNATTGHPVVRLSQVIAGAVIVAWLVRLLSRRERFETPPAVMWPVIAFVAWAGLSALLVGQRVLLNGWVALAMLVCLVYVLSNLHRRINWGTLGLVLLLSGTGVALFGLYQFMAGALGADASLTALRPAYERQVFGFPRLHSTALEPLYFANYLIIPLFVSVLAGLMRASWWKPWHWVGVGIMALAFLLTMSRGAFIGAAVAVVAGVVWQFVKPSAHIRLRAPKFAAVAALLVLLATGLGLVGAASLAAGKTFWHGPQEFLAQVTTKLTTTGSFTERSEMRDTAWRIVSENPWTGVGISGITPYLKNYPGVRSPNDTIALNNQFLELLAETGIIGACLFYGFLLGLLVSALRAARHADVNLLPWIMGLSLAVIAMTLQAQTFSGFLLTHLWAAYGLLLAAIRFSTPRNRA